MDSKKFYREYHGHQVQDLKRLHSHFKSRNKDQSFIYFAGDSSLDNKYWLHERGRPAVNGYESILDPPFMLPDVNYFLNKFLAERNSIYKSINSAIEETTVASRQNRLLPQDIFINQHITNEDILVVSVGGNDIALQPSCVTAWNMLLLNFLNNLGTIERGDPATIYGSTHFIHLFKDEVGKYIQNLIGNCRPRKVVVCMIYFPDEKSTGSWADTTLSILGYNSDPRRLQAAIRQIYKHATCEIKIEGVKVIPFPMFATLDGSDSADYVQRVEPSSQGSEKLARSLIDACLSD